MYCVSLFSLFRQVTLAVTILKHLNPQATVLLTEEHIKSGPISKETELLFLVIGPETLGLAFIAITIFVINSCKKDGITMRKILMIFMCVSSFSCFSYGHTYEVSGEDKCGHGEISGLIDARIGIDLETE